jgi:hypothetical protein
MSRVLASIFVITVLLAGVGDRPSVAAPLFTLAEDGKTFLYRARPGDHPGVVAEMFGIPSRDIDAFLKANHITDATRIDAGFEYRIPNPVAARSDQLETENARLTRAASEAQERARTLEREASEARATAAAAEQQVARLPGLETRWSVAKVLLVLLILALAGAGFLATAAVRRQTQADRYASSLALQVEEKQRRAVAERQEAAKRIIDLETRIRTLEAQLGPRVVIGGRNT